MKKIVIIDCGPSLKEVSSKYGQSPQWIMNALDNFNYSFTWEKAYSNAKICTENADAWIITGSPHSVYDKLEWIENVKIALKKIRKMKKPILGICFGHQLIAETFGGKVELNPKGWELGSYEIELTDLGKSSRLFNNFSSKSIVYESHQDYVVKLPEGARELAFNSSCTQSFQLDEFIFTVQFHPEFSWDIIREYVKVRTEAGIFLEERNIIRSEFSQNILYNFSELI